MSYKLPMRASALAALLIYGINLGCSSVREVPISDAVDNDKVYSLKLKSYEIVEFDDDGGRINAYQGIVVGRTRHGKNVSIKLSDVQSMRTDRTDTTQTVAWTIIGVGAFAAAVLYALYWWDWWD